MTRTTLIAGLLIATLIGLSGCSAPRRTTFEKGVEFLDYSDYPRAIEQFKRHIERHGEGLNVCYNLGVCYQDQADYDNAVVWYEKALEFNPRDGDTLVNLGLVLEAQGRDLAALAKLKAASDAETDRGYPLVALAMFYQRRGDRLMKRAEDPNNPKRSSDLRDGTQALETAREYYDRAVEREEKSGYAWYHYGTLHEYEQRYGDAAQAYERSTDFDNTNPAAHAGAARCYSKQRNYLKAITHYDFAIHLLPDRPEYYVQAAEALMALDMYERAAQYLWNARSIEGHDDAKIRKMLLVIYPLLEAKERGDKGLTPKSGRESEPLESPKK